MALHHASSGELIALTRIDSEVAQSHSVALAKTEHLELIRMVLPKGKALPTHSVPGELTFQCLQGEIAFEAHGRTIVLHANEMLYLAAGEPYAMSANADSLALLTILR